MGTQISFNVTRPKRSVRISNTDGITNAQIKFGTAYLRIPNVDQFSSSTNERPEFVRVIYDPSLCWMLIGQRRKYRGLIYIWDAQINLDLGF